MRNGSPIHIFVSSRNDFAHYAHNCTGSPDAAGVERIEAPGAVGEARLVARAVHALLERGVAPDSIVVAARHVPPDADV